MTTINIVKSDSSRQPLDVEKIHKVSVNATKGLKNVDPNLLEIDTKIKFVDGMSSSDIQDSLIKTAVEKIDIDAPEWTFVASRLVLFHLYHKVNRLICNTKNNGYPKLGQYINYAIAHSSMWNNISAGYDLDDLDDYISYERDFQFTYLGIKTLIDRYLLKDKNNKEVVELPQHMFMCIAMFLAQNEQNKQQKAKEFYDVISKFEVMLATPTLSNARTTRHQLSSCYVGSTPDHIECIFDSYKEMALLSKFGGGIGWDWNLIRSMGGSIDSFKGAAGGIVPFLKINNDVMIAVDQLGTRLGACATYIEPWHLDINDFIDLKKNSGEERRRAHELFPALWLNDLFMDRINNDDNWTLFDPADVDLAEKFGDEFNESYVKYENDVNIRKEIVKAKDLWKKILRSYFESGSPFLCFKDEANRRNPNNHTGIIRSSNLCTEIFQTTSPDTYKIKVKFTNGDVMYYDKDDKVVVGTIIKQAEKLSSVDYIGDKQVKIVEKEIINGRTAICNLASVNLSKINKKDDFERVIPVAVRMLDNVVSLNYYVSEKIMDTSLNSRAIGLGVMGEAELLASSQINWGSTTHFNKINELMEMFSYNTIDASIQLAKERGKYPEYDGSNWSKGILPIDNANTTVDEYYESSDNVYDWDSLKKSLSKYGIRNGYLMAIAPTSSISILVGTTQAIEPVFKRKWYEENLSGQIPVVVPKLSPDTWQYYDSAYDIDQISLIKGAAIRQKWIDQGQSLNIFMSLDKADGRYLNSIYMTAWKLGVKSTYYLRSQSPDPEQSIDRSMECTGCQ